jgi:hypothetical protein
MYLVNDNLLNINTRKIVCSKKQSLFFRIIDQIRLNHVSKTFSHFLHESAIFINNVYSLLMNSYYIIAFSRRNVLLSDFIVIITIVLKKIRFLY